MTERKTAKTLKTWRYPFALQNVCIQLYSHPAWALYLRVSYMPWEGKSRIIFYFFTACLCRAISSIISVRSK